MNRFQPERINFTFTAVHKQLLLLLAFSLLGICLFAQDMPDEPYLTFWNGIMDSNYSVCDSLVAHGFVVNDYATELSSKLMDEVEYYETDLDEMYYGGYEDYEIYDETDWADSQLTRILTDLFKYKLELTNKDELVKIADEYELANFGDVLAGLY